jgi:hypothetical protein
LRAGEIVQASISVTDAFRYYFTARSLREQQVKG